MSRVVSSPLGTPNNPLMHRGESVMDSIPSRIMRFTSAMYSVRSAKTRGLRRLAAATFCSAVDSGRSREAVNHRVMPLMTAAERAVEHCSDQMGVTPLHSVEAQFRQEEYLHRLDQLLPRQIEQ